MKLRPGNIIITGGSSGIGLSAAQKLLDYGVKTVVLASRNVKKLEKAQSSLKFNTDTQRVYISQVDISNCTSHKDVIRKWDMLIKRNGGVADGLLISSGINFNGANWKGFNISETEWDRVLDINLKGPFFLMREFANHLQENNVKGNICIVSSISAHRDLLSVYQISKNAISGIVHAYGKHLCERGVVLNCVEPGTTDTPMMPHLTRYTDGVRPGEKWRDNSIGRVIRPEEVAETICFLMSEYSEVLSGTCLLAGGGCKSIAR